MPDEKFDFQAVDTSALTPSEWSAVIQRGVRQAHIERARAARQLGRWLVARLGRRSRYRPSTALADQPAPVKPVAPEAGFALPITVVLSLHMAALRRRSHTPQLGGF